MSQVSYGQAEKVVVAVDNDIGLECEPRWDRCQKRDIKICFLDCGFPPFLFLAIGKFLLLHSTTTQEGEFRVGS